MTYEACEKEARRIIQVADEARSRGYDWDFYVQRELKTNPPGDRRAIDWIIDRIIRDQVRKN